MTPISSRSYLCLFVALACLPTSVGSAAVIYDNFGPNNAYFYSPGTYPIWNQLNGSFIHRAAGFTVPGNQNLQFTAADLGFYSNSGPLNASIELAADNGGVPGTILETINFLLPAPSSNPTIVTATSNTNPTLTAGASYWVIASMTSAGSMATWGPNNTGATTGNVTRTPFMNGQWINQGPAGTASLRIHAQIPEPAAATLAGLATLGLAARRRRRGGG